MKKSRNVLPNFAQRLGHSYPRQLGISTHALGHPYPSFWSFIPVVSVARPRVHGHPCSCSRALFHYVLCAGKYRCLHPFYIHVFHSQAFDVLYRCASVCSRKWIGVLIDMGRGAGRTGISCWKIQDKLLEDIVSVVAEYTIVNRTTAVVRLHISCCAIVHQLLCARHPPVVW